MTWQSGFYMMKEIRPNFRACRKAVELGIIFSTNLHQIVGRPRTFLSPQDLCQGSRVVGRRDPQALAEPRQEGASLKCKALVAKDG